MAKEEGTKRIGTISELLKDGSKPQEIKIEPKKEGHSYSFGKPLIIAAGCIAALLFGYYQLPRNNSNTNSKTSDVIVKSAEAKEVKQDYKESSYSDYAVLASHNLFSRYGQEQAKKQEPEKKENIEKKIEVEEIPVVKASPFDGFSYPGHYTINGEKVGVISGMTNREFYFLKKGENFKDYSIEDITENGIVAVSNDKSEKYSLPITTTFSPLPLAASAQAPAPRISATASPFANQVRQLMGTRMQPADLNRLLERTGNMSSDAQNRVLGFLQRAPPQFLDNIMSNPEAANRTLTAIESGGFGGRGGMFGGFGGMGGGTAGGGMPGMPGMPGQSGQPSGQPGQ
ncbi:hypothetical protein HZA33_05345 [Candidatus Pacearchaeota archaeon]|nr:hypothetical protein [Candidatus Pacearchaeota archaeon]